MVDTVNDRGLPDMPANVGDMVNVEMNIYSPIQKVQYQGLVPVNNTWV
jgi:hypothetical protein